MNVFLDALWDACNRPLRGEPVYVQATNSSSPGSAVLEAFRKIDIDPANVLIAHEAADEFWFPVDCNNYLIASYCVGHFTNANLQGDFKTIFGGKRQRQTLNEVKKYNPRTFYHDLCNKLLTQLITKPKTYPYNVTCEDVDGLERKLLVLHFKKR